MTGWLLAALVLLATEADMSRRARLLVFLLGAAGVAALYLAAVLQAPAFGTATHPLRDAAVRAALAHATANVVSCRGPETDGAVGR